MDKRLRQKIEDKIQETLSNKDEIKEIVDSLEKINSSTDFILGIVIGRLYNSFYYQTRRILNRNPTTHEFNEFVEILKERKISLEKNLTIL